MEARIIFGIMGVACIAGAFVVVRRLMDARGMRKAREERKRPSWDGDSGAVERRLIDHVADAHGFEYAHYQLRDRFGNEREAWCRIVPTTIAFA